MCIYEPGNTFRPLANKDNDYLMDRAAQKAGRTYSGIAGFAMQDAGIQEKHGSDRGSHARRTWSRPTTASSWRAIV